MFIKSYLSGVLILLIGWPASVWSNSEKVDIRVILEAAGPVMVSGPSLRLGDLAAVVCTQDSDCDALKNMDVGVPPRPGQTKVITMNELRRVVSRLAPDIEERIEWSGSPALDIHVNSQMLDGKFIEQMASRRLQQWLDEKQIPGEVRVVTDLQSLRVPVGELSLTPRMSPAAQLRKRMPIWIDVLVDQRFHQTVTIWFSVTAEVNALVTIAAVEKGVPLTESMVRSAVVDIAQLAAPPISTTQMAGLRTRRGMEVGTVLTESDVETIPAVVAGAQVTVVVQEGLVALSLVGVAEADADLNENLNVRNPSSGQSYSATVVAPKTVRVH